MTDLISRQEAIDVVNAICERCGKYKEYNGVMCGACALDGVEDSIEDLPSAEPVRHGMFIGTEYDGYADGNPVYYEWKCSECGCIFEEDEPTYRYCPNCGAYMKGTEDGDK